MKKYNKGLCKIKLGKERLAAYLLAVIIVAVTMNVHYGFRMKAEGNSATIVSQEKIDIYFPGAASVQDRASMFVLMDDTGNTFEAFCADYMNTNPPDGTTLSISEAEDPRLLKVLYYGWKGPGQWEGFENVPAGAVTSHGDTHEDLVEAYARIATTICATAVRMNQVPQNAFAVPYWEYLFGENPAPDVESVSLSFSETNPAVSIVVDESSMYQKSEVVNVNGDEKYSTTIQIPEGITLYLKKIGEDRYSPYSASRINLPGGSSFYLSADIRYTGDFAIQNELIDAGQYYVLTASPAAEGYQMIAALRLKNSYTNSLEVSFIAPKGKIMIKKTSAYLEATEANPSYTLEGACFGLYGSMEDAQTDSNRVDTLVTDVNGNASREELLFGTYYVKELSPSEGYCTDDKIYPVIINDENNYTTLNVDEIPMLKPVDILVEKQDEDGCKLEGVCFQVNYYKTAPDAVAEDISELTPDKTYTLMTDAEGCCRLSDAYKISGDEFYHTADGEPAFPMGVVTIREISAPEAYIVDGETKIIPIEGDSDNKELIYNAPTVVNREKQCIIKLHKTGASSVEKKDMPGVTFRLYAKEDIKTAAGSIKYKAGEQVAVLVTDEKGMAVSDRLYMGCYELVEERCDANMGYKIEESCIIDLASEEKQYIAPDYYYELELENKKTEEVLSATYVKTGDASAVNTMLAVAGVSVFGIIVLAIIRKTLGR